MAITRWYLSDDAYQKSQKPAFWYIMPADMIPPVESPSFSPIPEYWCVCVFNNTHHRHRTIFTPDSSHCTPSTCTHHQLLLQNTRLLLFQNTSSHENAPKIYRIVPDTAYYYFHFTISTTIFIPRLLYTAYYLPTTFLCHRPAPQLWSLTCRPDVNSLSH